MPRKNNILRLG